MTWAWISPPTTGPHQRPGDRATRISRIELAAESCCCGSAGDRRPEILKTQSPRLQIVVVPATSGSAERDRAELWAVHTRKPGWPRGYGRESGSPTAPSPASFGIEIRAGIKVRWHNLRAQGRRDGSATVPQLSPWPPGGTQPADAHAARAGRAQFSSIRVFRWGRDKPRYGQEAPGVPNRGAAVNGLFGPAPASVARRPSWAGGRRPVVSAPQCAERASCRPEPSNKFAGSLTRFSVQRFGLAGPPASRSAPSSGSDLRWHHQQRQRQQ
jgi:hypothetical protein